MNHYQEKVVDALKSKGAALERAKKHAIWRFPDGTIWVTPQTPSDVRAWQNNWTDLRTRLGLNRERGVVGVRREKKTSAALLKPCRTELSDIPVRADLRTQMMRVARQLPYKYKACCPVRLELIERTVVTVFLGKIFGILRASQ